jgi:two-component system, OmpR family, sensor histidine kinase KdpD
MYSPENQPIDFLSSEHDRWVQITVRDFGPGLSDKEQLIFEKFYRAEPRHTGGIGLGLSIVRNFIELQNGKVTARSHQDGGAEFSIFLPIERLT